MNLKAKVQELKQQENFLNKYMGQIDKEIKLLLKEKNKISKQISHNVRYRNKLINEYYQHESKRLDKS